MTIIGQSCVHQSTVPWRRSPQSCIPAILGSTVDNITEVWRALFGPPETRGKGRGQPHQILQQVPRPACEILCLPYRLRPLLAAYLLGHSSLTLSSARPAHAHLSQHTLFIDRKARSAWALFTFPSDNVQKGKMWP